MSSDVVFKAMNALHRSIVTLSRGRLGLTISRMPVLGLTTVGRKSGQPRTVLLTSPLQDGATLIVVASRGGDDKPPAWLLNLQAQPDVQVRLQAGSPQPMRARVCTPADRAALWPRITSEHRNYAGYQHKTEREIALVRLEPSPSHR